MSDIERVFWTVLFRMAPRVFLFFTPSDSSLVRNWFVRSEPRTPVVKLFWEAFQPLFSWWLRWLMKPSRELYLSFSCCSFFSAQSSFVSMALMYSMSTHNFSSMSKARPSSLRAIQCLHRQSRWRRRWGILRCFPEFGPILTRSWWENLMYPHVFQDLVETPFRMGCWRKMPPGVAEFSGGFPYREHQFPPYAMVDGYSWKL